MVEDDSRQAALNGAPAVPVLLLNYHSAPTVPLQPFRSYLAGSILAAILMPPIGIIAVILSVMAGKAHRRGDASQARYFARRAAHWGMASFTLAPLLLLMSCVVSVLVNIRWAG